MLWRASNTGHVQVRCQVIGPAVGSMWASRELVTYSTEQGPYLEANRFSAIQKSPAFYVNPKVHYRVYKSAPPVPILSQILPPNFLKIHLYIIPPSTPGSSRWILSLTSPHPNPVRSSALPHTCYMPRQSHSSLFYHPNNIRWGVHIVKLLVMYFETL